MNSHPISDVCGCLFAHGSHGAPGSGKSQVSRLVWKSRGPPETSETQEMYGQMLKNAGVLVSPSILRMKILEHAMPTDEYPMVEAWEPPFEYQSLDGVVINTAAGESLNCGKAMKSTASRSFQRFLA